MKKRKVNEEDMKEDIGKIKKVFWREVNSIWKEKKHLFQLITDSDGDLWRHKEELRSIWREYFDYLNFRDDREAELSSLGKGGISSERRR